MHAKTKFQYKNRRLTDTPLLRDVHVGMGGCFQGQKFGDDLKQPRVSEPNRPHCLAFGGSKQF